MDDAGEAKALLAVGKYREAARVLDGLLRRNQENSELWYLRGLVSLKLKSYDNALECFERALALGKKSRYHQIKGMAHFEIFELDEAEQEFLKALALEPDDATTNFFLAMCYLFQDDPRSERYIAKAYKLNGRKTKQLLMNFYTFFLKRDPRVREAQKKNVEERIRKLK